MSSSNLILSVDFNHLSKNNSAVSKIIGLSICCANQIEVAKSLFNHLSISSASIILISFNFLKFLSFCLAFSFNFVISFMSILLGEQKIKAYLSKFRFICFDIFDISLLNLSR